MSSIEQPGGGPNPSKRIKKSYSVDQQRNVDADNFNGGNNDNDELLQLQWNNHSNAFGAALANLRVSETFCDVTLISANGENYSAHRVVISACSSHLETMLKPLPRWQHPVLLMPSNVPNKDLRDILAFMYSGEVSSSYLSYILIVDCSSLLLYRWHGNLLLYVMLKNCTGKWACSWASRCLTSHIYQCN